MADSPAAAAGPPAGSPPDPTVPGGAEPVAPAAPTTAATAAITAHATVDAMVDARHSLALSWTALRRGRRPVLAPADVRLPAGAVVGLVGANGAGKSTLLMALAGVLAARCGRAWALADGSPIPSVGYLPQRPALAPWLSVRDALALHGVDAATALGAIPSLGALATLLDRRADALSGGQAQILAVAAVLARGDPLVLLDEPFTGVDLRHRAALVACVGAHRSRRAGSVIILASHLAADLDALCDWLLVLDHGAAVFAGPRHALPGAPEESHEVGGVPPGMDGAVHGATRLERRLAALLR